MLTEGQKRQLEKKIYKLLKESIFEEYFGEEKRHKNDEESKPKKNSQEYNARKEYVMKFLDDNKTLHSELAYHLWPNKDEDSARSLFSKKYNGFSQGKSYSFKASEINKLYNMVTSFVEELKK